jgi:polysaccharide biosynthesis/export protein
LSKMSSDRVSQASQLNAADPRLLEKSLALMNAGIIPTIVFVQNAQIDASCLTALSKMVSAAKKHRLSPQLANLSLHDWIKLEIASLAGHFTQVELQAEDVVCSEVAHEASSGMAYRYAGLAIVSLALVLTLAGCTNRGLLNRGESRDGLGSTVAEIPGTKQIPARHLQMCPALKRGGTNPRVNARHLFKWAFGAGDVLRIEIAEGTEFSGTFSVNADGSIALPYAGNINAAGLTAVELSESVKRKLVSAGYFNVGSVQVAVLPLKFAPVNVSVSGAVYQPGRAVINDLPAEKRDLDSLTTVGDAPLSRNIDAGLRAGAGIRPDADISRVKLTRGAHTYEIDLTGLVTGLGAPDIPLMPGDLLDVPSSGCFHEELLRPSQATPPGMRVFISNLTVPATGNNPSAVDSYATNLPYGTRLVHAAASANCIGGADTTNASRSVVLISANPLTGQTEAFERRIEDLVRNANRDDVNPFVLPNDVVACYDSNVTNLREVARTVSEVLGPMGLVLGLI